MNKQLLVAVSTLVAALHWSAPAVAQKNHKIQKWTPKAAAATFEKRCASCHVVPDVSMRTDRAWLDQINRTT